jgi:hypothetical protein
MSELPHFDGGDSSSSSDSDYLRLSQYEETCRKEKTTFTPELIPKNVGSTSLSQPFSISQNFTTSNPVTSWDTRLTRQPQCASENIFESPRSPESELHRPLGRSDELFLERRVTPYFQTARTADKFPIKLPAKRPTENLDPPIVTISKTVHPSTPRERQLELKYHSLKKKYKEERLKTERLTNEFLDLSRSTRSATTTFTDINSQRRIMVSGEAIQNPITTAANSRIKDTWSDDDWRVFFFSFNV